MSARHTEHHIVRSIEPSLTILVSVTESANGTATICGTLFDDGIRLAFAADQRPGDCRLLVSVTGDACLWIGHAAFDIDPKEVDRLATLLVIPVENEQAAGGAA